MEVQETEVTDIDSISKWLNDLGQDLMQRGKMITDKLRNGKPVEEEVMIRQGAAYKEFNNLVKLYNTLVKMGTLSKPNETAKEFEKNFLETIKNQKSSMGSIVADANKK